MLFSREKRICYNHANLSCSYPLFSVLYSFLVDLLLCVGRVAPVCLDQMFTIKEPYFQSPYDCHFNDSAYSKIQQYRTCKHLTTTTTTLVAGSPPTTTFQTTQKPVESKSSSSLRKFYRWCTLIHNAYLKRIDHNIIIIGISCTFPYKLSRQ